MSQLAQTQSEGDIWAGLATSGTIPERLIKRGIDNMGIMAYITKGPAKFLRIMTERFPKAKNVSTREHKVHELNELDRIIDVTVASNGNDYHATFGVSNKHAAQLQANDVLFVKGLYCFIQGTTTYAGQVSADNSTILGQRLDYRTGIQPTGVVYSTTYGIQGTDAFIDYEQMLVVNVGDPDSAGVGSTTVQVYRAFTGPGANDLGGGLVSRALVQTALTGATESTGVITTALKLLRGLPTFPEGTGAPKGFHANPVIDNNFTQEFKYAVEQTNESTIETTWLGKTQLEINKLLRMKQAALDLERAFLFSRKTKTMDRFGRVQYTMGGVVEFIPKDADHIQTYQGANLTYQGLLDMGEKIFNLGGGMTRDMYVGLTLYTELKKAFYSSGYLRYNKEESARFDVPIETIEACGGSLNIIPLWTMQECGFATKAIVLDMSVPSFQPVTHADWDMKVEKDIANKGEQIYKEQWIGMKGLERRYAQYQSIVDFSAAI